MTNDLTEKILGKPIYTEKNGLKEGLAYAVQKGNSELNEKKPNFWKKISKLATKVIAIPVIAGTLFTGCPNPTVNFPPTADFQYSSVSVKKDKGINFSIDGTDDNGKDDIVNYSIQVDLNSDESVDFFENSDEPILNKEYIFDQLGDHKVYGIVTDSKGLKDIKEVKINVYNSEPPTVDFSQLEKDFIEGKEQKIELPLPSDEDSSGEIPYDSFVKIISGDIESASINPSTRELTIVTKPTTQNSNYSLEINFGTEEEGVNKASLEGIVKNLCTISGRIESTEDIDTAKPGVVEMYNHSTNELLATINTEDGNFEIQADSPVDSVRLEGRLNFSLPNITVIGNNFTSVWYFDGEKDHSNASVVCVPADSDLDGNGFADLDKNRNNEITEWEKDCFRTQVDRMNFNPQIGLNSKYGLKKWNYGEVEGIEKYEGLQIVSKNPVSGAEFTTQQITDIETFLRESGSVGANERNIITDINTEKHYEVTDNRFITSYNGWGIIVPALPGSLNGAYGTATAYDTNNNGYIDGFEIYIDTRYVTKTVVVHEEGHGNFSPGHASENDIPKYFNSIMEYNSIYDCYQPTDKKLDYITKNNKYPAMKPREEILK